MTVLAVVRMFGYAFNESKILRQVSVEERNRVFEFN